MEHGKMKNTLFNPRNVLISLKSMVTSIVSTLIIALPLLIAFWLINAKQMLMFGRGVQILSFIFYLWLWGYFANKFWGWK